MSSSAAALGPYWQMLVVLKTQALTGHILGTVPGLVLLGWGTGTPSFVSSDTRQKSWCFPRV